MCFLNNLKKLKNFLYKDKMIPKAPEYIQRIQVKILEKMLTPYLLKHKLIHGCKATQIKYKK